MNSKIHSQRIPSYADIPCRVIIHEILTFYKLSVGNNLQPKNLKYCLFGYFKNDLSRHIWFVFSSINLKRVYRIQKIPFLVDTRKLYSFEIQDPTVEHIQQLNKESESMYSLQHLTLHDDVCFRGSKGKKKKVEVYQNIFRKSKFRNLKSLVFNLMNNKSKVGENWHLCETFFHRLERLEINIIGFSNSDFFSKKEYFKNIRILKLEEISLKIRMRAYFPSLKKLHLGYVFNIVVVPGKNTLRNLYLSFSEENKDDLSEIMLNWNNLRTLNLNPHDTYFHVFVFEEKDIIHLDRLRNLETLKFSQANFKVDILSQKEFPSLKKLTVFICEEVFNKDGEDQIWKCSKTIKYLEIFDCEDSLFQKNEWPNLEELKIFNGLKCLGKSWKQLPKIRKLMIRSLDNFKDDFFRNQEFKMLEDMDIRFLNSLQGTDWRQGFFDNVRKLRIDYCPGIGDSLFQRFEFKSLSNLLLVNMKNIYEEGWIEMKNIAVKKIIK